MMSEDKEEELEGTSIPVSRILKVSAILAAVLLASYFVFFQLF